MTYPLEDQEEPARRVTGKLTRRWVGPLRYEQALVDGVPVDPDTIEAVDDEKVANVFDESQHPRDELGRFQALEASVKEHYERLYGPNRVTKQSERIKVQRLYKAKLDELQAHPLYGKASAESSKKSADVQAAQRSAPLPQEGPVDKAPYDRPSSGSGATKMNPMPHPDSPGAVDHLANLVHRLDKGDNMVHLADLRESSPGWSHEDFNKAMRQARVVGRITLSAHEGRHGLTERDRSSAIPQDPGNPTGTQLGYASVRR
jgi:hypothetical protein